MNEEEKERKKARNELLKEYGIEEKKIGHYSIQRFDIIVVAFSTTAIILLSQLIFQLIEKGLNAIWFVLSSFLFVLAIMSNLIAQYNAYHKYFKLGKLWQKAHLDAVLKDKFDQMELDEKIKCITNEGKWAELPNQISIGLIILSVLVVIIGICVLQCQLSC